MGAIERRNAVLYLRLPADLKKRLMNLAGLNEMSLTELAVAILKEWVDENEQQSQAMQEGR